MLQRSLRGVSKRLCSRSLHYIVQRDTNKTVPQNDIFIISPDTAPVLACLNYQEVERELRKYDGSEVMTGTFVVNGLKGDSTKKLRKHRGVATLAAKVKETTVLAVCDVDVHAEAYESGATHCIAPQDVGELDGGSVSVEQYDAVVCTTRAMPSLVPLGRVLKTKMPHERKGTVAPTIQSAVRTVQLNIEWEMTDSPNHPNYYNITVPLIKSDFPTSTLQDHVSTMFREILTACPAKTPRDKFIERLELNWSRDPIHVDIREHNSKLKTAEVTVLKKAYTREETWALRESAKNKTDFLDEEKTKIGDFLEERWQKILKE